MNIILDNFHQGGIYTSQIASHQAELRIEEQITDQEYLSVSSLHNDYLNLENFQVLVETMINQTFSKENDFFVEVPTQHIEKKDKKTQG